MTLAPFTTSERERRAAIHAAAAERRRSQSLHGASAFAPEKSIFKASRSLHGGHCFSPAQSLHGGLIFKGSRSLHGGIRFAAEFSLAPPKLNALTLSEDVLHIVLASLSADKDIAALTALLSVCTELSALARAALAAWSIEARLYALTSGQLAAESAAVVEAQAAAALLAGSLDGIAFTALIGYANDALERSQVAWVLNNVDLADDPSNDRSFRLLGLDAVPLEAATCRSLGEGPQSVTEWYAVNRPEMPLGALHLPCVLAGPPRFAALAGTSKQARSIRRIPLPLCRLVRRPDLLELACSGCSLTLPGATLIAALLDGCA